MKIQYKYSYPLYFFIFVTFNHIQIEKINIYSYNLREDIYIKIKWRNLHEVHSIH